MLLNASAPFVMRAAHCPLWLVKTSQLCTHLAIKAALSLSSSPNTSVCQALLLRQQQHDTSCTCFIYVPCNHTAPNDLLLQLEKVAADKWGGMLEVEAERNAREQKRLKRALESTGRAQANT